MRIWVITEMNDLFLYIYYFVVQTAWFLFSFSFVRACYGCLNFFQHLIRRRMGASGMPAEKEIDGRTGLCRARPIKSQIFGGSFGRGGSPSSESTLIPNDSNFIVTLEISGQLGRSGIRTHVIITVGTDGKSIRHVCTMIE